MGCGTTKEVVYREHYVAVTPDESLRQCTPKPPKPTLKDSTDVGGIIVDLFNWGDDCSSKHDATWQSIDELVARVKALNKEQ